MTDIKSAEARSQNMSAIKGRNTKPEQYICRELFARGYRYRKNVNYIEGHPDLFLKKYNAAIFVHGCFWHRHKDCKYSYFPKSRQDFWRKKFVRNIERDLEVQETLKQKGIRYMIVWECTVKKMSKDELYKIQIMEEIERFLRGNMESMEL